MILLLAFVLVMVVGLVSDGRNNTCEYYIPECSYTTCGKTCTAHPVSCLSAKAENLQRVCITEASDIALYDFANGMDRSTK